MSDTIRTEAHAVLFGFPPEPVAVQVRPRSPGWRAAWTAATLATALVVAPVVAVVPPHAPWVIGALAVGIVFARRRWTERFTVVGVEGPCPRCGSPLRVKAGRLKRAHPLPCEACHHASTLQLPEGALEGGG